MTKAKAKTRNRRTPAAARAKRTAKAPSVKRTARVTQPPKAPVRQPAASPSLSTPAAAFIRKMNIGRS
jgi:hypothetical protein